MNATNSIRVFALALRVFPPQHIDTRYYAVAFRTCQLHKPATPVEILVLRKIAGELLEGGGYS
jgi:hypothetical protein